MNDLTLLIDTSDFDSVSFAVAYGATIKKFHVKLAFNENYKTAELLEKFFKKEKLQVKDLKKVVVCSGPGSFTGIRVGVSLAQALGYALNIPVIALAKAKIPQDIRKLPNIRGGKTLVMNYGQKPNITKAKK